MSKTLKIHDTVKVIAGAHKGTVAKIVRVDRQNHRAFLENLGVRERHIRASRLQPHGTKKTIQLGLDLSNLQLVTAGKFEPAKLSANSAKIARSLKSAKVAKTVKTTKATKTAKSSQPVKGAANV